MRVEKKTLCFAHAVPRLNFATTSFRDRKPRERVPKGSVKKIGWTKWRLVIRRCGTQLVDVALGYPALRPQLVQEESIQGTFTQVISRNRK